MHKKIILILNILFSVVLFSQNLQLVSLRSDEPLSGVLVINSKGDLIATSDVEGMISKEDLQPIVEPHILFLEGHKIGNISAEDISKNKIALTEKITEIEAVVVKKGKFKFLYITGNFNVYLTINKQLNVYADGVATYVFDQKSKKLKNTQILQYRSFLKEQEASDRKKVATVVYQSSLKTPELDKVGKMLEENFRKQKNIKIVETAERSRLETSRKALDKKEFSLFGYRFFDFNYYNRVEFSKDALAIKNFLDYSENSKFKIKHKTEESYSNFEVYANFIPTEMSFQEKNNLKNTKLKPENSNYNSRFWEEKGFPNMLPVFEGFSQNIMKEQPNVIQ